ncbi:hypothetical protein GCM10022268_32420 [Sphingomonas cynarae]|uniref:Ice-binding protein C-terminal domain-containing protein n=1 Tax=Sphingomonas cynarae TaxID=930197 RepID=A0ABP7ETQ4_9SPHN
MNNLLKIGYLVGAVLAAAPASATDFTFDLRNDGIGTPAVAWGNSFLYQATASSGEKLDVMVSGWSRQFNGSIKQGAVASWDPNGLGIYQQGESTAGALHQIDNVNGWEFLSFQFSKAVTLTSGVFNAYTLAKTDAYGAPITNLSGQVVYRDYRDNDAFLGWGNTAASWNSNLGLQNYNQATVFGSLSGSTNTSSNGTAAQTFNLMNAVGNTWLIGASINGPDNLNDAFKLAGLTVQTAGSSVVSPVPEPATWAMMLVGFGMVAGAARYRRRSTKVAFA